MRNFIALICALTMACLTGLAHATHLKGGSVTWKKDTQASNFTVHAEVIINFDLSSDTQQLMPVTPSFEDIPKVNGKPFYKVGDIASSDAALDWGNGRTEGLTLFEVVKVDAASQLVIAKAIPTEDADLTDHYDFNGVDHYDIVVTATARDTGEELANRISRDMALRSRVTNAAGNIPPSFNPVNSGLVIVNQGTPSNRVVTFNVPVATDPDAGDTVKYSFIEQESDAGTLDPNDTDETPWEKRASTKMSMTEAGVISWDTADIDQTILTRCIQVVARDYAPGSTVPKSSTTLEFQVWVNDTTQTGVPEIVLAPATPIIYVQPDQPTATEFRVIGFDHGENSRLNLVYNPAELPVGAVMLPTAGFTGSGHHIEGDYLTCRFSWKPTAADLDDEYLMHFKFEDEDGHESEEVAVTVRVVSAPPPTEPLVLTLSQASFTNVQQGAVVTFTATGTCAATGLPVSLSSHSELPEGASFSPVLPAQGTSNVTSTFTWQTGPDDFTLPNEPIKIEVILADAYRRETIQTVTILMGNQPPAPVVTLAAGTVTPIPATAWDTLVVNFNASGGSHQHHDLMAVTENAGDVEEIEIHSPGSGTVVWRVIPGQLQNGMLRIRVTDEWGTSTVLQVPIALTNPGAPGWWDAVDPADDVLTGGAAVDFSMANHGQLKAIATRAYARLLVEYPNIATATTEGAALAAYVGGFNATTGNYEPLLQGELKHAGKLFYDAIGAVTGKGYIGYPWSKDAGMDRHASPATAGQVKMVFSFPQPLRGVIFNEPPSSVVITSPTQGQFIYSTGMAEITVQVEASDPDNNLNRVEFYKDGMLFATDTSAPYEAIYDGAPFGSHVFTAKAVDARDLERTSSAVTVTVASSAPSSIALLGLTEGEHYLTYESVPIQVATSDPDNNIVKVEIWLNGYIYTQFEPPNMEPYQTSWMQTSYGDCELWAKVYDADGQSLESEHIHVVRDYNAPPVVTFSSPTQNQKYVLHGALGKVDLTASAYDPDHHGVGGINFYYTNTSVGGIMTPIETPPATGTPATVDMDWTPTAAGEYIIHARAYDTYGAPTTITRNISVVAPTVVTLQEGVNGYTGMVDTHLSSKNATSGADYTVRVRQTDTYFNRETIISLLKWNLTSIPTNATVLGASMDVYVEWGDAGSTSVFMMKTPWDEMQATWDKKSTGVNWHAEGASGTNDVEATAFGSLATSTTGWKTMDFTGATPQSGLTKLKGWISTPSTNHGLKLKSWSAPHSCGISSSEHYNSANRPKLTVTYWVP